jgi:hypothetical protein
MTSFIQANSKIGACEVCGDDSGKCRRLTGGELHLCMTYSDTKVGQIENGFKCVANKQKGWASFKIDNSQQWSEQQREEWRLKNEQKKQQRLRIEAEKKANHLSSIQRDRQYRSLLGQLSLHPDDRADLIHRGFSEEEIRLAGFKSVEQWQKLTAEFSHLLPGVGLSGRSLIVPTPGYLCPVRDADGLIVAMQLRVREVNENNKNRYRWLSSGTKKNPNGQTPHLYPEGSEGELPLAVFRPQSKPVGISLAEGTGAKPFLVSQRFNQIVVAAAGGQWASSQITFRSTLEKLSNELDGVREIILHPDAGDILNNSVMYRWQAVVKLLKEWGWIVKFSWWNQKTKEDADIDELSDFTKINFISQEEFFSLGKQKSKKLNSSNTNHEAGSEPITDNEYWQFWQLARKFNSEVIFKKDRFDIEVPELNTLLAIKSGLGTGKTYWLINRLLKHYSHLGAISIGHRNSLLLQFTEQAGNWYHLQKELKGTDDMILIKDPTSNIACCADSLVHFSPESFEGKILILDETESIINHLLLSETNVGIFREKVKEKFVEALNRSAIIVCLDGHLSDKTINYLQGLIVNSKKLIKVENTYKGNRGTVDFYKGIKKGDSYNPHKCDDFINLALNNSKKIVIGSDSQKQLEVLDIELKRRGRRTLRYDSSTHGQWINEFLKNPEEYLRKYKIDVFLYSPSGDAGLNIDIKEYFTDLYFLFVGVLTTNSQLQMLGRIRDPKAKIHIYCAPQGLPTQSIGKEVLPEKIREYAVEYMLECAKASLQGVSKEDLALDLVKKLIAISDNKHFEHECILKGLEQHERTNLRKCLRLALEESGYLVSDRWTAEDTNRENLKNISEQIAVEKSAKIYNAPTFTAQEIEQKSRQINASPDEKLAIVKSRLMTRLPGIENATYKVPVQVGENNRETESLQHSQAPIDINSCATSVEHNVQTTLQEEQLTSQPGTEPAQEYVEHRIFDAEFIKKIKFDNPGYISQLEKYYLLTNPETAKKLQQLKWHNKLSAFTDPENPEYAKRLNISDWKSHWLKIHTLMEMGIGYFLAPGAEWSEDSPEVLNFYQKAKNPKIARITGFNVGKSKPCEFIGRTVLRSFGLKTESRQVREQKNDKSVKTRIYSLSPDSLSDPIREAVLASIAKRYEDQLAGKVIDFSTIQEPLVQSEQEIQLSHLASDYLIKPEGRCDSGADIQFCLQTLTSLEAGKLSQDEAISMWCELEERSQNCVDALPEDFWQRAVPAFSKYVVESPSAIKAQLEAKLGYKVQRVEILPEGGNWVKDLWINASYELANFLGQAKQWVVFNSQGDYLNFFGELRLAEVI